MLNSLSHSIEKNTFGAIGGMCSISLSNPIEKDSFGTMDDERLVGKGSEKKA